MTSRTDPHRSHRCVGVICMGLMGECALCGVLCVGVSVCVCVCACVYLSNEERKRKVIEKRHGVLDLLRELENRSAQITQARVCFVWMWVSHTRIGWVWDGGTCGVLSVNLSISISFLCAWVGGWVCAD